MSNVMTSVDLVVVLVAVGAWWLIIEVALAAARWADRKPEPPKRAGVCRCGHGIAWHQHHRDRTYCAVERCGCPRFRKETN